MRDISSPAVAMTVAGSDSGGGAGLQADLRTFAILGVRAVSVVTCLTAQNRHAVTRIEPVSPAMIRAQLEAIFAEGAPAAAKTGMLYSASIIRELGRFLKRAPRFPLVVDPVMIATSGRRLLQREAVTALQAELLALAALVTPNVAEAEVLTGEKIRSPEDMRTAAKSLHERFGCAALVKGGHLDAGGESIDILFDGKSEWMFGAPRIKNVRPHGLGCVYSAAIAAYLAKGRKLPDAVRLAKEVVTQKILAEATR